MALPARYDEDEAVTLFHAGCRDVLPLIEPATVALLMAEPPYGVGERRDRLARQRSAPARQSVSRFAWEVPA
jgi:hypothetical protein